MLTYQVKVNRKKPINSSRVNMSSNKTNKVAYDVRALHEWYDVQLFADVDVGYPA